MNLAGLSAYQKPLSTWQVVEQAGTPYLAPPRVCWNQMSDRPEPSVQRATIPTGYYTSSNRRHTSVTSSRPGCQTPGGVGCDIKHNSYDRYLNRLKGKGPLRRGVVPPTFGLPIPFNPALPVYGGKTIKTNIVSGCDCPIVTPSENFQEDIRLYDNPFWQPDPDPNYGFSVGTYVYAIQIGNDFYTRALVIDVSEDNQYTIVFDDGSIQYVENVSDLRIYFPCNCNGTIKGVSYKTGFLSLTGNNYDASCIYPII
jgi:hypothetical protein